MNEISFVFDEAVALSLLRLSNYSKDPARGVDDFELLADGLLVYRGRLRRASGGAVATFTSALLTVERSVLRNNSVSGGLYAAGGAVWADRTSRRPDQNNRPFSDRCRP